MSRKLYLNDAQVAALQDALKPLTGKGPAELDSAIRAVMGLRRNTPKNWCYRIIDGNGNEPDLNYQSTIWDTEHVPARGVQPAWERTLETINGVYVGRHSSSIRETKDVANRLSKALSTTHFVERRECIEGHPNARYGPWESFYIGKAEKVKP